MTISALVHSQGTVFQNQYIPLEIAYVDVTGVHVCFLIKSPLSFWDAARIDPNMKKSLHVVMTTRDGVRYSEVERFLSERYTVLKDVFGPSVLFGYKGQSYQKNVLGDIPSINLETLGCPSLRQLQTRFPNLQRNCPYHLYPNQKCARHVLQLLLAAAATNFFQSANSFSS